MSAVHELSGEAFAALAAGGGGIDAVGELAAAELSKHILLLQGVVHVAHETGHPQYARAREGFELLAAARNGNRGAADEVIRYPPVAVWARRTVLGCRQGESAAGTAPARLCAVGAAAAIRAGLTTSIDVPAIDHRVLLPSLGEATVPGDGARVEVSPGRTAIGPVNMPRDPSQEAPGWAGLRRVSVGPLDVLIDDRDPYRMPDLTDLAPGEPAGQWESIFHGAWPVLTAHHPGPATEIAAAVTTIVPRARPRSGSQTISTSSSEAFGTVAMSLPPNPVLCAETLVHEVQHLKLGAIQDLVSLTFPDDGRTYYAPWRPDPRPAAGLLQGTYAFLGVAAFWRRQREVSADPLPDHTEYARWRDATAVAVQTLSASSALTPAGIRFVGGMARTLDEWRHDEVPSRASELAQRAAHQHRSRWETTHGPVPRP